jgi:hypothetical protein
VPGYNPGNSDAFIPNTSETQFTDLSTPTPLTYTMSYTFQDCPAISSFTLFVTIYDAQTPYAAFPASFSAGLYGTSSAMFTFPNLLMTMLSPGSTYYVVIETFMLRLTNQSETLELGVVTLSTYDT